MHGPGLLHLPTRCFEEALSSASDIDITGKDHPNARLCTQRRFCPFTLTLALQEEPQPYALVLQVQYSNGRVCTTVYLWPTIKCILTVIRSRWDFQAALIYNNCKHNEAHCLESRFGHPSTRGEA